MLLLLFNQGAGDDFASKLLNFKSYIGVFFFGITLICPIRNQAVLQKKNVQY